MGQKSDLISKGGRRVLPLGRDSRRGVLRAPHSWPVGQSWPPSVKASRKTLDGATNVRRREGGIRGRMRSARSLFTYAGALAYRAIEQPWRRGDIVESFSIFVEIAESQNTHHFARYRAPALYNATILLQMMPARAAITLAGRLASAAVLALNDQYRTEVAHHFESLVSRLEERAKVYAEPAHLRWSRGGASRLIPLDTVGRERVPALPEVGFRGTYIGVKILLGDYGFVAPQSCSFSRPITVKPEGSSLRVTSM